MKALLIGLIITTLLVSVACSNNDKPVEIKKTSSIKKEPVKVVRRDSIKLINDCGSNSYTSKLEENHTLDSNSFLLTIQFKDGSEEKRYTLDAREELTRINYCTEDYTVVGFACGGPCYSQFFVFTKEDRPVEQYGFCQRVYSHPNIITHIKNEEFDTLIVHNFDNGNELKVGVTDCKWGYYSHIDTMYMQGNNLIINYPLDNDSLTTKVVNLESIIF